MSEENMNPTAAPANMVCCTAAEIDDCLTQDVIEELSCILPMFHTMWSGRLVRLFQVYKDACVPCPFEDEKKHLKAFYMKAAREYARLIEKEAADE